MGNQHDTERQKQERTGMKCLNKQGLTMYIKDYHAYNNILVCFEDDVYMYQVNSNYKSFCSGSILNPYYPSVYGVGILGNGQSSTNGKGTKEYKTWSHMLARCYDEKIKIKYPTYQNVICCKEWLYYENFCKWLHEQKNYENIKNIQWELDKDILIKGNKNYSPDTCCLVPHIVNSIFIKRDHDRGKYPIGVTYDKRHNQFCSQCNNPYGKRIVHNSFLTPEEAFYAYKKDKEMIIKQVAQEEYNKGNITMECYEAMMNYQVEITD